MISGTVRGLTPILPVTLEDRGGRLRRFQFIIDTAFNGALSLPWADIQRLGLTHLGEEVVTLADGSSHLRRVYGATVHWHDERHAIRLLESGLPLLGMRLLNGSRVGIDVVEDGPVSVEPL